MPTFSRKQLRRDLAQQFVHDLIAINPRVTTFGNVQQGGAVIAGNPYIVDSATSGQGLYQGAWLFFEASTGTPDTAATWYQYTIASWNTGSGAFLSGQVAFDYHGTASYFEVHTRVPPLDKNIALDDTIKRMRIRQEVALNTVDGAMFYTIDGCASPYVLDRILDVHLYADPTDSLNLDFRYIDDWAVVSTATGNLLRLKWAVAGSQQLALDAILIPSLGGETATINLPDERWILAGAAAKCIDFQIQSAPPQQVANLMQRRAEYALEYSRLAARFMPTYDERQKLHDVVRGYGPRPFDQGWF